MNPGDFLAFFPLPLGPAIVMIVNFEGLKRKEGAPDSRHRRDVSRGSTLELCCTADVSTWILSQICEQLSIYITTYVQRASLS